MEANKIGFPSVILPGDVRNDLYLTLEQGYFERGGKAKNVEVSAIVIGRDSLPMGDSFQFASGVDPVTKVTFPVLFHSNSPHWNETVRMEVPIESFEGAHIRFEFRHCSSKHDLK